MVWLVLDLLDLFRLVDKSTRRHAKTEKRTGRWTIQRLGNGTHVGNHSLDAVALALNLGNDGWHLVAVEWVVNIPSKHTHTHTHTQKKLDVWRGEGGKNKERKKKALTHSFTPTQHTLLHSLLHSCTPTQHSLQHNTHNTGLPVDVVDGRHGDDKASLM